MAPHCVCRMGPYCRQALLTYESSQACPLKVKSPCQFAVPAGTIVPGATCAVLVTFCPRALGQHSTRLEVQVLAEHSSCVVATTHIDVLGQSDSGGRYTAPVGGVSALPESFAKPRQYVDQDEVGLHLNTKRCRAEGS